MGSFIDFEYKLPRVLIFINFFAYKSGSSVLIMKRIEVGNPTDYFDKTYEDYKKGFQSRGESHMQK